MGSVNCRVCTRRLVAPDAVVTVPVPVGLEPFPSLPLVALAHADCAARHEARPRDFVCVERTPTGYPLRFEAVRS